MTQQIINIGTVANDGTGDPLRTAYDKINDNETELYTQFGITPPNAQTGTTYTLVLADMGKLVTCSNAASIAVTLPANASVAYPAGATINVVGIAAGGVTITAAGAATINGGASVILDGQYVGATLIQTASIDAWVAFGKFV